jgi:hypothetical protein
LPSRETSFDAIHTEPYRWPPRVLGEPKVYCIVSLFAEYKHASLAHAIVSSQTPLCTSAHQAVIVCPQQTSTQYFMSYAFGSMFPLLTGSTPPSVELTGVCVPVPAFGVPEPAAGVPSPLNGVTAPLGGTGILMSSGLLGTSFCGRPSMWMRLAELL